jgi:hemerythrin-like domain-containing protein
MKRSDALSALSRDHHHVLVEAKSLRDAEPGREDEVAGRFVEFWAADVEPHLAREEEVLVPPYLAAGGSEDLVRRLRREHAEIREHAEHLRTRLDAAGVCSGCLGRMGDLLHDHVRFEERELFPDVERVLPPGELDAVGERLGA